MTSFIDNLLEFFEKRFPFGDGAGAGIQGRVPLRAELFDQPLGALQRVGDLLASQLALQLVKPTCQLKDKPNLNDKRKYVLKLSLSNSSIDF